LLHSYSPFAEFKPTNSGFLKKLNYLTHERSLHIGKDGCSRNILLT
ncbi:pathogenicity island 1 effector protein SopD, partial [Salmonella enterica subsp. enterica serovar Schwarzengrund]